MTTHEMMQVAFFYLEKLGPAILVIAACALAENFVKVIYEAVRIPKYFYDYDRGD